MPNQFDLRYTLQPLVGGAEFEVVSFMLTEKLCKAFGLNLKPPIYPTIQRDVADAAAGKQRLAATFARYDDSAWQQIVAALPPARSY